MAMNEKETEVKFYVNDLKKIEMRLLELKAHLIQPRVYEVNYRYDLPDGSLRDSFQVLRLRKDVNTILTYKGPSKNVDGISTRTEYETTLGDLETAQRIFEALGYVQVFVYEKYRAVYDLNDCHIMLDELPYGNFVEIEGTDMSKIRKTASQINLDLKLAVKYGYIRLHEKYITKYGLPECDLTFEVFQDKKPSSEELGVYAAD